MITLAAMGLLRRKPSALSDAFSSKRLDNGPMSSPLTMTPIAIAHSPFAEKFGIPRQPGIAPSAQGIIELLEPYNRPESVRGLEGYSHIWLIFVFHGTQEQGWRPTVRPPRLGGNQRMGVFATRSTFRPNPIGLSCVKLDQVETTDGVVKLHVSGLDLMDGTPILDIKPYIPFADCHPEATAEFVPEAPEQLPVIFTSEAEASCPVLLRSLVIETLAQDPRPAYQETEHREYGLVLSGYNIRFYVAHHTVTVIGCAPIETNLR